MPSSLANRLLFHSTPQPDLVFASSSELTIELFDFIALALRAYVSPWWSKLSRYDRDLLPHIASILIVVLSNVEQRIKNADIPALTLIDIPNLITQHYKDYRTTVLQYPHIAFDNDGNLNPEYFRQIIDHILRQSLPEEDYAPEAERLIIRELLVNVLLKDVLPRLSHPCFIYTLLLDLIGTPPDVQQSHNNIVVIVLSALQAFSSFCLALIHSYHQAVAAIQQQNNNNNSHHPNYIFPTLTLISEVLSASSSFSLSIILTSLSMLLALLSSSPFIFLPSHILLSTLSSPSFLLSSTRNLKRSLFPNAGFPGPTSPEPTDEQVLQVRQALSLALTSGRGRPLTFVLPPSTRAHTINAALDPLSDQKANQRLFVYILDAILLAIFPELAASPS